ncbi:hypothetical protein QBZ16_005429 [Prototheca wickerhamii]|uniref:Uncharacterized protein n=1 Tax=Prototheca wickerhamii TaxID=3111 RepID=A0AAD9IE95_PROWI|nr:hypothetical protein QBZ16_005429 [Prototheca wickerhamii]
MAKSLRSKVKRHFRSQKAAVVDAHPHVQSKEAKRQAILDRARSAPKKKTDEAAMDVVDEVENEEMEQSDDEQQHELNSATRRVLREMKHKKLVKKSKYSKRARQILKNQGSKKKRKL